MPDDPYSLADLARMADVTTRTIRYYVAQGLLPSPDAAGPATRYSEGHLARLRLIRRLQKEHLPLAEIRARLELLGDEAILVALDSAGAEAPEPPRTQGDTLAFVRNLMAASGVTPRTAEQPPPVAASMLTASRPSLQRSEVALDPGWPDARTPRSSSPLPGGTDRSTWERIAVAPDIEIHVRRPLAPRAVKQLEVLLRMARDLFSEDA